jgi:mRNA-degrading endonuclease RelE of RelBE toxin-antitoxin system
LGSGRLHVGLRMGGAPAPATAAASATWCCGAAAVRSTGGQDLAIPRPRMRHEIILAPEAVQDLRRLPAHVRSAVKDAFEKYLRYEPTKPSRSRIKRLRGMARPRYRLRVGDVRVFHDVAGVEVDPLAIVPKSDAAAWLAEVGEPS